MYGVLTSKKAEQDIFPADRATVGGGSVANTISENNSCMIILLLPEVLISNICNIADCCIEVEV